MLSILDRALSWVITSLGNKFCLKKRSRFIRALDNRFYVKFMQLEIGLLVQQKYTFYYTLFWCFVLFVWILAGVTRNISENLVFVLSVRLLLMYSLKVPFNTYFIYFTFIKSVEIWVNHLETWPKQTCYLKSSVHVNVPFILTLRAPRVLVPTPSTKGGGSKRTPPVSQEREMLQTWNLWRG